MLETLSLDLKVMFNKAIDNDEINLDMSVDTFVDFMTYGIWGVLYNNLSILSEDNIKKNEEKVKKIFTLVFSLLNDENHIVKFYLDKEFLEEPKFLGVHPNDNTATIWIKTDDLINIIKDNGYEVKIF